MCSGIYKIANKSNGKIYIGSSFDLEQRKARHFRDLERGRHHSRHLQNAYNKYGADSFDFVIIEKVEKHKTLEVEQKYLDELKPYDDEVGYNISEKATNCVMSGEKHWAYGLPSEEHHWFGRKHTEETKKKISEAQSGERNHMYGKRYNLKEPRSEEWRRKQRAAHLGQPSGFKGKKHSEEARRLMSEKAKGRPVSDKVRNKSPEWLKNISLGRKGKCVGGDNPNAVAIIQMSLSGQVIARFDSLANAARHIGHKNQSGICNHLKGRSKSCGGYLWAYA